MIRRVVGLAGSTTFLDDICVNLRRETLQDAVGRRDTPKIFDWMLKAVSFQGISDQVARGYLRRHGNATWSDLAQGTSDEPRCPLLHSYWHFDGCRYDKTSATCSEPEYFGNCSLPRHRLRNGRLNQTAYSLFLFMRDIAHEDIVGWIDGQLRLATSHAPGSSLKASATRQESLIGPLRNVYGISDKIIGMTLSELLLGASDGRPDWFETGKDIIVVDTLVHNFLHRTGILEECGSPHAYGAACYASGGCCEIIRSSAEHIDARDLNRKNPQIFPRLIQHSLWRFCAADGRDICNGNQIDDRKSCQNRYCQIFAKCKRKQLKSITF